MNELPAPDTRCLTLVGFRLAVWRDHDTWRGQAERLVEDRRVRAEYEYVRQILEERR
ncbi:MAG: hypothetical protein ACYC36_13305 [Bellilinea sp.]